MKDNAFTMPTFWETERRGRDAENRPEMKLKITASFCFSKQVSHTEYYHNSSWLENGGAPDKAVRSAVDNRQETIRSIAQAIVDAQPGFFRDGLKGLKPLTMEAVARKVGVHPATVSRTVRDKYASTPKGVVELRRFFTSGYSGENGESVSRDALQERIRELIAGEERSKPYSDDRISELLKNEGFTVARRTVAKYRAILGIPGASERKVR